MILLTLDELPLSIGQIRANVPTGPYRTNWPIANSISNKGIPQTTSITKYGIKKAPVKHT